MTVGIRAAGRTPLPGLPFRSAHGPAAADGGPETISAAQLKCSPPSAAWPRSETYNTSRVSTIAIKHVQRREHLRSRGNGGARSGGGNESDRRLDGRPPSIAISTETYGHGGVRRARSAAASGSASRQTGHCRKRRSSRRALHAARGCAGPRRAAVRVEAVSAPAGRRDPHGPRRTGSRAGPSRSRRSRWLGPAHTRARPGGRPN